MAIPFNPISITIGKDGLSSFKSLRIDQSTGAHHHFDLTVDLESGGNRQVHNISSSKEWLGKDIIVKAASKPFFCGIVTNRCLATPLLIVWKQHRAVTHGMTGRLVMS